MIPSWVRFHTPRWTRAGMYNGVQKYLCRRCFNRVLVDCARVAYILSISDLLELVSSPLIPIRSLWSTAVYIPTLPLDLACRRSIQPCFAFSSISRMCEISRRWENRILCRNSANQVVWLCVSPVNIYPRRGNVPFINGIDYASVAVCCL